MSLQLPDLAQCADEPIRVPGAIQPHGWLIILSAADGHLVAHSQNCPDVNAIEGALAPLREDIAGLTQDESPASLGIVEVASEAYGALAHRRGDIVVIEFELRLPNSGLQAPIYALARNFLPQLQQTESVQQLATLAASELKRLTGFGRCIVYSFDSSGHGQVLAEVKESGYQSFIGHHFPAADIPAQARDLYVLNHFRLIPDARYQPVPLHCVDPAWRPETIDLSLTVLRSRTPCRSRPASRASTSGDWCQCRLQRNKTRPRLTSDSNCASSRFKWCRNSRRATLRCSN